MNEQLRTEARRLLDVEEPEHGKRPRCRHHVGPMENRLVQACAKCTDEMLWILHDGAKANRFLNQWRDEAMKLLRETFGLAAAEGTEP